MKAMTDLDVNIIIDSMVKFEGFEVEEAVLTSKARSKLPSTAFCGPNRTYPAHDKARVRNALARLSQFGKRLKPATRARILSCLKKRAKRMGIEVSEVVEDPYIRWYRENYLGDKNADSR